jgi:hypothetical protein
MQAFQNKTAVPRKCQRPGVGCPLIVAMCFKNDDVQSAVGEGYCRSATDRPAADDDGIPYATVH